MAETTSGTPVSTARLILIPAVVTLVITVLRLVGELQHWSKALFNPSAGGGGALVGISWLPIIFGPYFAVKLARSGAGPTGAVRTMAFVGIATVTFLAGAFIGFAPQVNFPGRVLFGLLLIAAAALIPVLPWPALGKTVLAYGYAARIPVVILMFFAMRGNWGTHYDVLPPAYKGPMDFWGKYIQIGFVPQMVFWIAYTIILSVLIGTIVYALVGVDALQKKLQARNP